MGPLSCNYKITGCRFLPQLLSNCNFIGYDRPLLHNHKDQRPPSTPLTWDADSTSHHHIPWNPGGSPTCSASQVVAQLLIAGSPGSPLPSSATQVEARTLAQHAPAVSHQNPQHPQSQAGSKGSKQAQQSTGYLLNCCYPTAAHFYSIFRCC